MTEDDIQLLYEYDRWANNRVWQAASAISVEQFARDLGGSFRSVRDTLVHIIGGKWIWLAYWKATSHSSAFLTDEKATGCPVPSACLSQCELRMNSLLDHLIRGRDPQSFLVSRAL
jgi:hypothetical protein